MDQMYNEMAFITGLGSAIQMVVIYLFFFAIAKYLFKTNGIKATYISFVISFLINFYNFYRNSTTDHLYGDYSHITLFIGFIVFLIPFHFWILRNEKKSYRLITLPPEAKITRVELALLSKVSKDEIKLYADNAILNENSEGLYFKEDSINRLTEIKNLKLSKKIEAIKKHYGIQ